MKMFLQLKNLSRENWILFFAILINRMGSMALVFLVLYLHKKYHFSIKDCGLIFSIYGVGALCAGQIGGWLSDRFGAFRTMIIGLFFSALFLFIYPSIHQFMLIALLTFFWSIATEVFRPANLVAICYFSEPSQRKAVYALNRLGINLGMSVGPIAGAVIAQHYFNAIFIVNGIATIAAATLLTVKFYSYLLHDKTAVLKLNRTSVIESFKIAVTDKRLCYMLTAFILSAMIFFQNESALPFFVVHTLELPVIDYGILFSLNTILIILFEIPINLATSHWRFTSAMFLGSLFMASGYGFLIFADSFFYVALSVVIWTLGEMMLFPGIAAYISEIAPIEKRGAYMGFYTTCLNISLMLGPGIGTYVLQKYNANFLWLSCFFVGVLSAVMFINGEEFSLRKSSI